MNHLQAQLYQMHLRFIIIVVIGACALGCRAEIHTGSPSGASPRFSDDTEQGWAEMQRQLVGKWHATAGNNRSISVSYRVVSNGSALVETFVSASGKETISVYHRDGRALMLTHYCAQGNQARLKATEATREKVTFALLDATNVTDEQGVMQKLTFVFREDAFDQESVYADA